MKIIQTLTTINKYPLKYKEGYTFIKIIGRDVIKDEFENHFWYTNPNNIILYYMHCYIIKYKLINHRMLVIEKAIYNGFEKRKIDIRS